MGLVGVKGRRGVRPGRRWELGVWLVSGGGGWVRVRGGAARAWGVGGSSLRRKRKARAREEGVGVRGLECGGRWWGFWSSSGAEGAIGIGWRTPALVGIRGQIWSGSGIRHRCQGEVTSVREGKWLVFF
ncbi:hypothetical protein TIFTF001_015046 [Ficus carica]|uniref:Uncharacterized protein n=1 Tax=Ficus carica TaxID=3494 RepID=A0AA88A755_FICCA|nr:hypothetical protein TIFTF001_015046 [Ficus carica]